MQTDSLYAAQEFRSVLRLNEPELKIGPSGNLDIPASELFGDGCELAQLKGLYDPTRDAQPRHERLLVRGKIEQAIPFEPEGAFLFGRLVARSGVQQLRI